MEDIAMLPLLVANVGRTSPISFVEYLSENLQLKASAHFKTKYEPLVNDDFCNRRHSECSGNDLLATFARDPRRCSFNAGVADLGSLQMAARRLPPPSAGPHGFRFVAKALPIETMRPA
jgi:hypothetical protein